MPKVREHLLMAPMDKTELFESAEATMWPKMYIYSI